MPSQTTDAVPEPYNGPSLSTSWDDEVPNQYKFQEIYRRLNQLESQLKQQESTNLELYRTLRSHNHVGGRVLVEF